jgi:hypothetical protein
VLSTPSHWDKHLSSFSRLVCRNKHRFISFHRVELALYDALHDEPLPSLFHDTVLCVYQFGLGGVQDIKNEMGGSGCHWLASESLCFAIRFTICLCLSPDLGGHTEPVYDTFFAICLCMSTESGLRRVPVLIFELVSARASTDRKGFLTRLRALRRHFYGCPRTRSHTNFPTTIQSTNQPVISPMVSLMTKLFCDEIKWPAMHQMAASVHHRKRGSLRDPPSPPSARDARSQEWAQSSGIIVSCPGTRGGCDGRPRAQCP